MPQLQDIFTRLKNLDGIHRRELFFYCALAIVTVFGTLGLIAPLVSLQFKPALFAKDLEASRFLASKEDANAPAFAFSFELKDVGVQVLDEKTNEIGYLQFTLQLDCPTKNAKEHAEANRARVLDAIFDVASAIPMGELKGAEGISLFKGRLLSFLQKQLSPYGPRRIDVKDWVLN